MYIEFYFKFGGGELWIFFVGIINKFDLFIKYGFLRVERELRDLVSEYGFGEV